MIADSKAPHHRDIALAQNSMVIDASSNSDLEYFLKKEVVFTSISQFDDGQLYKQGFKSRFNYVRCTGVGIYLFVC